ncbi:MAG: PAS-domain containing protein [Erythrobacter sp.]
MEMTPLAMVGIALLLAAWTIAAAVAVLRASAKTRRTQALQTSLMRMQHMLDVSPAIPLLVRVDGRIEAPERLARWLGLERLPAYLSELAGGAQDAGLDPAQVEELSGKVRRTQKTGKSFVFALTLPGSKRSLAIHGTAADPQVSPGGAALLWVFDFSQSQNELTRLRDRAARATADFGALVGLIEAAPMPMWFRDSQLRLQLVNLAYIEAVGASGLDQVLESQIELLEPEEGMQPAEIAREALETQERSERIDAVTIHGERRALRISELPLGREGVAGYAFDVEEQQQLAREFQAFREAQRTMLDQLSVGVAQFTPDERLTFANRPFRRLFGIDRERPGNPMPFTRFLTDAREVGRTPEVRDFPEWRRECRGWFELTETHEENWPLPGGTHLRIVAQPMPDGGLVMIAEDRTEQLKLSAVRDTLLRTRTATLDSLFEALAIFAPDSSVQLWNRSFAGTWGLASEFLDTHPSAEALLDAIAENLAHPGEAQMIGSVVRAATLDRREKRGQVNLADGRTLRFAGVPLPDGNGLLIVLDITDAQMAEQALRERAAALEEADAVKARFLANMSYEFRTPLTTIGGFAELLGTGTVGELSEDAKGYVDAILTAVSGLTEQVENVLDLSQSEAGMLPMTKKEIELLPFLTKLVRERESEIITAGIGLDLKGRAKRTVEADPRQLGRAFGHLLTEAIATTPKGGKIVIELDKAGHEEDGSASITLSTRGEGGARFAKPVGTNGRRPGGATVEAKELGLRLAHQLIEAHGGSLAITNDEGAGTKAVITLK